MLHNTRAREGRSLDPQRNPEIDANSVKPFGPGGVGLITDHPVGWVFAIGIVVLAWVALPEARVFLLTSVPLGGLVGWILWMRHR